MKQIDHVFDAIHTQIEKPDSRAYQIALQALNKTPEQVVFVDDQIKNINGAKKLDIDCIHFNDEIPNESFAQALVKL